MDENHKSKTDNIRIATEDVRWVLNKKNRLWIPQHEKQRKVSNERIGFSGRTLWDWLNLLGVLAIPFVVTIVGIYFTQQITQQQTLLSNAANKQQHQTDLEIAADQQRETTLKTYLDDMSDLLLNHNLSKSKPGDIVSEVARERTLTVLRRLDANRNRIVLQFLQDAHLISGLNVVIDLSGADLSNDDLRGVYLSDAYLDGARLSDTYLGDTNLRDADLRGADLSSIRLSYSDLSGADLCGAKLGGAELSYDDLSSAHLSDADLHSTRLGYTNLRGAELDGADLSGANLGDTDFSAADLRAARNLTQQQLDQVSTCKGAILPEGLTCPQ